MMRSVSRDIYYCFYFLSTAIKRKHHLNGVKKIDPSFSSSYFWPVCWYSGPKIGLIIRSLTRYSILILFCLFAFSFGDFQAYTRQKKNKTYILKPESGSQGKGIWICKNPKEIKPNEHSVCQQYVSKVTQIVEYFLGSYQRVVWLR